MNQQSIDFPALAKPALDKGAFAGAVMAAADRERIHFVEAAGFADIAKKTPMRPDSLFWIASQTKPITGTAVMPLIEQGKAALDEPISKYLAEFKTMWVAAEADERHILLKAASRQITLRDVLCHMSGLPFCTPVEFPVYDLLTLEQRCRSYSMLQLQSEPGTKYSYSNAGTNIAGWIIELVSGLSYPQYLDRRFLGPLGMDDTTFWPSEKQIARLAKSYQTPDGQIGTLNEIPVWQLHHPLSDPTRQPLPAGGLFSTAADCLRFCQMVMRGGEWDGRRYLSEQSVATMLSRHTPMTVKDDYGLGWARGKFSGAATQGFGHGGAFQTDMWFEPEMGLAFVFLVQHAGPSDEVHNPHTIKVAGAEAARKRFGRPIK